MKLKTKFQDEAFKFDEVADVNIATMPDGRIKAQAEAKSGGIHTFFYDNLKTFANDWEDYEEPKTFWYIRCSGEVYEDESDSSTEHGEKHKQIGNYFGTEEQAEKAVERLRAWKRLKDNGFEFTGWDRHPDYPGDFRITASDEWTCDDKDLNLLFGGEEQ